MNTVNELPRHISIIMDGNGRWANQRQLSRLIGHNYGAQSLKKTSRACLEIGIKYLTVYAFSTENWRRPKNEIKNLMNLFKRYFKKDLAEIHKNNIRVRFIGERSQLSSDIISFMDQAVNLTQNNDALHLTLAFNYGGRHDLVTATRKIAENIKAGIIEVDDINEEMISQNLYTHDLPNPDLMIRTANTVRLSNFLLWEHAYTEFMFTDTFWPDFTKDDLLKAIAYYQSCERKFGNINAEK